MPKSPFTARVIVIHPVLPKKNNNTKRLKEDMLIEILGLARAIDLKIVDSQITVLGRIKSGTFLGRGKIEELKISILSKRVNLTVSYTHLTLPTKA